MSGPLIRATSATSARTYPVGKISAEVQKLITVTEESFF